MHSSFIGRLGLVAKVGVKSSVGRTTAPRVNLAAYSKYASMSTGIPKPPVPMPVSIPEPSLGKPVAVKAYYIARGIEIVRLHGKLYPSSKQEYQPKSVTITVNENLNQYISVFSYGSVVLFNIPEEDHSNHIGMIKTLSILPISEVLQHNESYKLLVHENLEAPSVIHAAHLNIRNLDTSNITIVSVVMAQTVALDYYAATVDKMVEKFTAMNINIQETGKFTSLKETDLYKLVASNNSVFTNVLSKLGFFEGTDVAWENAEYSTTWEGKFELNLFATSFSQPDPC